MREETLFHDFKCIQFEFDGTIGYVAMPEKANRHIVLKTEYWDAFPELEIELIKRGFHVIHLKNKTRLATKDDCDRKAKFVEYVSREFDLETRCILVGMSAGGAQAINFASYYPDYVSLIFVDAPVVNFVDFPAHHKKFALEWENEFVPVYPGVSRYDICFLEQNPVNRLNKLLEENIPIVMAYGTNDDILDYDLNGRVLEEAYMNEKPELITVIKRNMQGHHPHGLLDKSGELAEFILSKMK